MKYLYASISIPCKHPDFLKLSKHYLCQRCKMVYVMTNKEFPEGDHIMLYVCKSGKFCQICLEILEVEDASFGMGLEADIK